MYVEEEKIKMHVINKSNTQACTYALSLENVIDLSYDYKNPLIHQYSKRVNDPS